MIMNVLRVRGLKMSAAILSSLFLAAGASFGIPPQVSGLVSVEIVPFSNYGTVSPNYNGQVLTTGKAYTMTAKTKAGYTFTGWSFTDTANNIHTNSKPKLTFTNGVTFTAYFVDKQKPALKIAAPPQSNALTNAAISILGTAHDNDAVTNVYWQLVNVDSPYSSDGWSPANTGNAWNNWWVDLTLAANTNTLLVYAVDRSGNCSPTNKLKMIWSAAPTSLSGMILAVASDPPVPLCFASSGSSTFSDETGVGTYTYKKTGPVAGRLSLKYSAPPSAKSNNMTVPLLFTNATDGTFNSTNIFSLSAATNPAPTTVAGADILLTDGNDTNGTLLSFLTPPQVLDNGNLFSVINPLVVWLSNPYPGNIADRVSLSFTHLTLVNGVWTAVTPRTYTGTVIATGFAADTNTVTIAFDNPTFVSKTEEYAPATGSSLNILTYYYTNNLATSGTGTFTYTNYSPAGSLLQLNQGGTNEYCILTFTNLSTTTNSDSGTFYAETYGPDGRISGSNSGSFGIEQPPTITRQPSLQTVTNGGTANFSVIATGSQPLTYQWQFSGNGTNGWNDLADITNVWGSIVSGSTTTNLTIMGATTNDNGYYQVVIANFESVTSSVAALSITLLPIITSPPQSQTVTNGGTVVLSAAATGPGPLSYQWQLNGTNLIVLSPYSQSDSPAGMPTSSYLQISPISTNYLGNYQVIVSNSHGSVTSTPPASLTFSTGGIMP